MPEDNPNNRSIYEERPLFAHVRQYSSGMWEVVYLGGPVMFEMQQWRAEETARRLNAVIGMTIQKLTGIDHGEIAGLGSALDVDLLLAHVRRKAETTSL